MFDKLKPKPPEEIPHKPFQPPDKLESVEGTEAPEVKFRFSDYMRFTWVFLLGYAEKELNPMEHAKLISFWGKIALVLGSIILILILILAIK